MPRTLLLADDSVTIQRVIELTFANEDVRVVSIGDGRRALQWMESEWPDIVLVDVEVPEVDGYAVAEHIKTSSRLKHVPVLLLAGAFEPVDEGRARSIGCDGVLIKPFEPQHLVTRVKELLDRPARRPFPIPVAARPTPDVARVSAAAELAPVNAGVGVSVPVGSDTASAKISLVDAFSALLAAEQSAEPVPAGPVAASLSDATIEDAVRRVLMRMTDELVRRLVVESAERLIREEIQKIKANPE